MQRKYEKFINDSDDIKERIKENLGKFIQVFKVEEGLYLQDVKRDLPYDDVLEVFVRVNSGGLILTKSDLVFSTIVLHLPEMEHRFTDLVDQLNEGGEFDFDIDFLTKTSFVLMGMGAKYAVDKLKSDRYLNELRDKFTLLERSLLSTKEFLKTDANILTKRFLKSDLALIPIVDFIYQQPRNQLPEGQAKRLRQYLYMSFFMRLYSYGADAKLDVIHTKIRQADSFPVEEVGKYMSERTGHEYDFQEAMAGAYLDLVLNIIQDGVAEIPKRRGWSLERDHIFPQSLLQKKGFPHPEINRVGNFRLINKTRNILKSNNLPSENAEFFGSDVTTVKSLFLRARAELSRENLDSFAKAREGLIHAKIRDFLGFS
jgi:hypothetical protein